MAKYTDQYGNITEVGNPELNPNLIKGLTQVPDTTPFKNSTIDSSVLNTPTPITPNIPTPVPVPDISKLDTSIPEMKPTASETQANDLTARLQEINNQLTGQSAYRATQEAQQGLPELLKTQTDLSARLKGLQNEALSIPLQLQQQAEGRGITAGGLTPIQTGALRENAIKALSISSMLEASRGNITLANDLVDKAVNAKYGPLLEEQKAKLANLDLILKSPAYSLEDKSRANAQKAIEDARTKKIEQEQKDKDEILKNIAIPATQNATNFISDGTPEHATLALTLDAISKAKTPMEALQIATNNGLTGTKNLPASAQEYEYARNHGYKGTYTQYQNEDANRKIAIAKAGVDGGLTPSQVSSSFKLADDYDKASGNYMIQADAYNRIKASASDPSAAGDLSLIFAYMKLLDPTSVVREGEFATAQNAGSAFNIIGAKYNKIVSGERLTTEQRNDFVDRARKIYETASSQQDKVDKTYSDRAKKYGIDPSYVIRDKSAVSATPVNNSSSETGSITSDLQNTYRSKYNY